MPDRSEEDSKKDKEFHEKCERICNKMIFYKDVSPTSNSRYFPRGVQCCSTESCGEFNGLRY